MITTSKNLAVTKLHRLLLIAALALCPLLAFQSANAQPVATASLTSGGSNSITITQNQQFTLSLSVMTNFPSSGYTVFYQVSPNGVGLFQLISRVNTSPIHPTTMMPVFNDPTTSDGVAFGGNAGVLMHPPTGASNQFDLGYTGDQTNNQPATPMGFNLQTVTINTLNAPVGTYTIFLDMRSIMTDRTGMQFNDVPMGGAMGPQFTVNVIPEPTTVGLAVLGGAGLLLVALRKRRAQA